LPITWNAELAAHLLRRTGFAASPKAVKRAVKRGHGKTVKRLIRPQKRLARKPKQADGLIRMGSWWVRRMVKTRKPLAEKLTLFWHNHFATAFHKVGSDARMFEHVATLRTHALGSFRELVLAMARDPAMLVWLDNRTNYADSINENWARELMEVFTTGVLDQNGDPNYTETDVVEVARAFTGWSLQHDEFLFKESKHDYGQKTVKGVTGNLDGDDIVDILVNDPATARRIPQQLWSFLAYPIALDDPLCDELAAVYVASDGDIATIVEAILMHDAFFSEPALHSRVKSPAEWMAGAILHTGARIRKGDGWSLGDKLRDMGQTLFDPPSVFGWNQGLPWVEASGLLARASTGAWIAMARHKTHPLLLHPRRLMGPKGKWDELDASAVVTRVLEALDLSHASPATTAVLEDYARADVFGLPQAVVVDDDFIDKKVRGLIAVALACPEYQMA